MTWKDNARKNASVHHFIHLPHGAAGPELPGQAGHRIYSCHDRRGARWHLAALPVLKRLVVIEFQVEPICCACFSTLPPLPF